MVWYTSNEFDELRLNLYFLPTPVTIMKLLTKDILRQFKKTSSQEDSWEDAKVICKFFNPAGAWTRFASEYDEATRTFYGLVELWHYPEYSYFSLDDLLSVKWPMWLWIERDRRYKQRTLKQEYDMLVV